MARGTSPLETMPVSRFARQTRWSLIVLAGAVLAFLYLPIAFLILFSFEDAATPGLPITGLTLHWYQVLASDTAIQSALLTSIEVAVAVTIIASIVGTMVAFPLVRGGVRGAGVLRLGFTLPIMIPGFLIGIGLLIFFRQALHPRSTPAWPGHGGRRPPRVHDPVRRADRCVPAAGLRPPPRMGRRRSRSEAHGGRSATSSCP